MNEHNTVTTERLLLRQWREEDLEPFAKLNADPKVMEFFPAVKTREESDLSVKFFSEHIERHDWGFWAASLLNTGEFIGFIGLQPVPFQAAFTPAVEIGWRLAFEHWGKGYATEGAKASLRYGFEKLHLQEIFSFTVPRNMRSRAVMERIGMHHDPHNDFDHPKLPPGHPLRRCVFYRIAAADWQKLAGKA